MPTAPFWPFTLAELTAGLRRYFADSAVTIVGLHEKRLPPGYMTGDLQRVRGLTVTYTLGGPTDSPKPRPPFVLECVVKELRNASRAGLANAGRREISLYRAFASQLPVTTPAVIVADLSSGWLVLEAVEAASLADVWTEADCAQALTLLVTLHERFWGLADDLTAYRWLARPLTLDYEIHVYAAAQALDKIVYDEWPPLIAHSVPTIQTLALLISQADWIIQPLRAMPFTLLHGNFGPAHLLRDEDGDFIVLDWQLASIGPSVLDFMGFLAALQWQQPLAPEAVAALIALYRAEIARRMGFVWTEEQWAELWDHARLWLFLQETLNWLVNQLPEEFEPLARHFDEVWLQPVLASAARRLPQVSMG